MRAFADLYAELDSTNKTNEKVDALRRYFLAAQPEDTAWAVHFLIGRRPKRLIETRKLVDWAIEEAGIPEWLFGESYQAVGDLAETISLLLPPPATSTDASLHWWIEERLLPLRLQGDAARKESLVNAWREMDERQRFVWNKLITGEFRVGVSQNLVVRALAESSGVDAAVLFHRLMGNWDPTADFARAVLAKEAPDADVSRPYPFCLAHPLEGEVEDLGDVENWVAEWKWDGIRSQLIRRQGQTFVWSRGEELVTDRFPELQRLGGLLPNGIAIDGEIMPWKDGQPLEFGMLQRRIGRKVLGPKILADVPVALVAYDLLEYDGVDIREQPLESRREKLSDLVAAVSGSGAMVLSAAVRAASWEELRELRRGSRERRVEGIMLKRLGSPYRVGRKRGDWWKWKIEPYSVDAVLVYAQPGSGKRASLLTDYTFGVWDGSQLVPIAKAYSGLSNDEIAELDRWIRRHTRERHGPVRVVDPVHVFELGFEAIAPSTRHKSGVAVRFPRMLRWRRDKPPSEADTLETLKRLIVNPA